MRHGEAVACAVVEAHGAHVWAAPGSQFPLWCAGTPRTTTDVPTERRYRRERRREARLQAALYELDALAEAYPDGTEDRDVLQRAARVLRFELDVTRRAAR